MTVEFLSPTRVAWEDVGTARLRVRISKIQSQDVWVPFTLAGTASNPQDYIPGPNPIVIPAGSRFGEVLLNVVDDALAEGTETVVVGLQTPSVGSVGPTDTQTVSLSDNDGMHGEGEFRCLEVSPWGVDFGLQRVGDPPGIVQLVVSNPLTVPVQFKGFETTGAGASDYSFAYSDGLPFWLSPGASTSVQVSRTPSLKGRFTHSIGILQDPSPAQHPQMQFTGLTIGVPGAEVLMTLSDVDYPSVSGDRWCSDYGVTGTSARVTSSAGISGTQDDDLYRTAREGTTFGLRLPLPDGLYDVVIHAAELIETVPGARVFDVLMQGNLHVAGVDLVALKGPEFKWASSPQRVSVVDGQLELDFVGTVGAALVAGVEVRSVPVVSSAPSLIDFGAVNQGTQSQSLWTLSNTGLLAGKVTSLRFVMDPSSIGSGQDFFVRQDGVDYYGGATSVSYPVDWDLPAQGALPLSVFFEPTEHDDHQLTLEVSGPFGVEQATLRAHGGESGWGYLHPVIVPDRLLYVDFDSDGAEQVGLDGSSSHTHEPGQTIAAYEWRVDGTVTDSTVSTTPSLSVGDHQVSLTIWDDKLPPDQASVAAPISVHPLSSVPGILTSLYDAASGGASTWIDNSLPTADYVERRADHGVGSVNGSLLGSGLLQEVLVQAQSTFVLDAPALIQFDPSGGYDDRVWVDGIPFSGTVNLLAGAHSLEVRWAVADLSEVPLALAVYVDSVFQAGFDSTLTHDESLQPPSLHSMTGEGSEAGGNLVTLLGFGFFPASQLVVNWGTQTVFNSADLVSWSDGKLELLSPPGQGKVLVSVQTPNGTSESLEFNYSPDGPVPIVFSPLLGQEVPLPGPTCAVLHPNGLVYVGLLDGRIAELRFDEDWNLLSPGVVLHPGVSGQTNSDLCGIAFNPYDDPTQPPRIYVGHGEHWLNGGGAFSGPSPFTGQVSVLTGPAFDNPVPLVTGLPTSNHDHGVNGLEFDHNGDLLICVGGNTNAGVRHVAIGDLDESPLSGAIVKALTSRPDFNGQVTYVDRSTGAPVTDQVFGESCDIAPGVHVSSFIHGVRNALDLLVTTSGDFYATDNGPNYGFGYESTGANTDSGAHAAMDDEVLWLEEGEYYGHANRNRGFDDPRQYIYKDATAKTDAGFRQFMIKMSPSHNGLDEYRSTAFGAQIRGWLVSQKWNGGQALIELDDGGRSIKGLQWITPTTPGLGLTCAPGGVLIVVDFSGGVLRFLEPVDAAATSMVAYEITPWRAPAGGGTPFVIGGTGFASGQVSVTIAGVPATVTSVSDKRVGGILPALPINNVDTLHDVIVRVGLEASVVPGAVLTLPNQPGKMLGHWQPAPVAPQALGEVNCAVVGTELFLMGEGHSATQVFDFLQDKWVAPRSARPYPGNHHGTHVWQGKVYLIGGLGSGSNGKVQIYDPATDSWSLGASMPWNGGSCNSALMDGRIYACGGIVGSSTVTQCAVYDLATDVWNPGGLGIPDMPYGVNHAASGTDGQYLYVFGGRGQGNWPQDGTDLVQRYDPQTQTWITSLDSGSPISPMLLPRGGTGVAVFHRGEFLVMGGESSNAVFDEVQAYDPLTDEWRLEAPLPTARHGVFPTIFKSRVYVVGGGLSAGFSASDIMEVFRRH